MESWTMDELLTRFAEFGRFALDYLRQPAFIVQAVVILLLFALSYGLSRWAEPRLEARAREIKGYPGLLRLVVVLLRRLLWICLVVLLTVALVLVRSVDWPDSDRVLSTTLLLALAWLLISIVSQLMRSRALGRVFAVAAWIYVATVILGISDNIAAVLDSLGFQVGETRLSALTLVEGLFLFGVLMWLAFSVGNYLDHRIRRSSELTPSLRILIGKVLRITLIVIAALVAVTTGFNINLTVFAVFAGALGVGIGFGLQQVVSNFVSGIVILLDRSIKPGDTISLGDTFGWVQELRARFVSVVTRDGREYLIPNEDFITHQVINWSFTDELVRLDVRFGVSYDADPHLVRKLAIEATAAVPRVVDSKAVSCWMTGFGDSSLDFLVRFWIRDPQSGLSGIQGTVLLALWDTFKEHGIAIPYPHREVIMKTPVEVRPEPGQ
jgi:small-conductance mechanosensitive channel